MKYMVHDLNEISWFQSRYDGKWADEKKCVPETIKELEDAGKWDEFLEDESHIGEEGERYVDMDEIFDLLRHESEEILARYNLKEKPMTYTVHMQVNCRADVEVEADSPEEAFEKAKSEFEDIDIGDLEVIKGERENPIL